MSAVIETPLALEVVFVGVAETHEAVAREEWEKNRREVLIVNQQASATEVEDLAAFLDLLYAADTQYIKAEEYIAPLPDPALDWDEVSKALAESQQILIGVQNLLAETLATMGVEDYRYIRVYADSGDNLHLVSEHPRREEIEAALNGTANADLRSLYHAATCGLSLAGGLVGNMSVPKDVLEKVKAKQCVA